MKRIHLCLLIFGPLFLTSCLRLAPQTVYVTLANDTVVSQDTTLTCTRNGFEKPAVTLKPNQVNSVARLPLETACTGTTDDATVNVKVSQAGSNQTAQTNFFYTNSNGNPSMITYGYFLRVLDKNAKLAVECFTDDLSTKPCPIK